jgi:hypothetical protein
MGMSTTSHAPLSILIAVRPIQSARIHLRRPVAFLLGYNDDRGNGRLIGKDDDRTDVMICGAEGKVSDILLLL